jgi:hypothetical protein
VPGAATSKQADLFLPSFFFDLLVASSATRPGRNLFHVSRHLKWIQYIQSDGWFENLLLLKVSPSESDQHIFTWTLTAYTSYYQICWRPSTRRNKEAAAAGIESAQQLRSPPSMMSMGCRRSFQNRRFGVRRKKSGGTHE